MNIPRPYQIDAHSLIMKEFETKRSTILHIATGLGKTFVASMTINSFKPKRVLFLANTDELIDQAVADIQDNCGVKVAIEKAGQFASTDLFGAAQVVVSSIQTQISGKPGARRYLRFKPADFDLVICDECHLSMSPSWRETLAHYQQNPDLKILGLSATPKRTDEQAMGQIYESVAYQFDILDAIEQGWLVPIVPQIALVNGLDFSHIKTTAGDLNEGQLATVMEEERNIQGICQPTLEAMFGLTPKTLHAVPPPEWRDYLKSLGVTPRRTLVYCVSVAQAELCCKVFSRAVDGVEWLCGQTEKQKRKDMIVRFKTGETCCLVNVSCLTTGFNNPAVELIVFGRPTKSWLLKAQITGRGTRALPGVVDGLETADERKAAIAASPKKYIRFLDFVGTNGTHRVLTVADILGGKVSPAAMERAKKMMEDGKPRLILATLANAELELEKMQREAQKRADEAAEARKSQLLAKSDYSLRDVDIQSKHVMPAGNPSSRDGRPFSAHQNKVLRESGIDPKTVGYRQGCVIYWKLMQKPSPGMIRTLIKFKYSADEIKAMSRKDAHAKIDAISKNGWRRTAAPVSAGQAARLETVGMEAP